MKRALVIGSVSIGLRFFLFALVGFGMGCTRAMLKPDENIDKSWIAEPRLQDSEVVSYEEASRFIQGFFEVLDQVIFDPDFKTKERSEIREQVLSDLKAMPSITRIETVKTLNKRLKQLHVSHLVALNPEKTDMVMRMTGDVEPEKIEKTVTGTMKGEFGIIRATTFLVPSITKEQVEQAKKAVAKAKFLIYDIRDNGGGSGSSIAYLIDSILGPNKTIKFAKTREAVGMKEPYILQTYFEDKNNHGSAEEIDFEKKMKFVEWKTSPSAIKDTRPTFVVINSRCASSADIFPMAIKEHRAAVLVGTKTAGHVLGGIAYKLSWKGYIAIMPFSQIVSPQGKLYEGIGVAPDYELPSCDEQNDKCIDEVIRLIKKGTLKPISSKL